MSKFHLYKLWKSFSNSRPYSGSWQKNGTLLKDMVRISETKSNISVVTVIMEKKMVELFLIAEVQIRKKAEMPLQRVRFFLVFRNCGNCQYYVHSVRRTFVIKETRYNMWQVVLFMQSVNLPGLGFGFVFISWLFHTWVRSEKGKHPILTSAAWNLIKHPWTETIQWNLRTTQNEVFQHCG